MRFSLLKSSAKTKKLAPEPSLPVVLPGSKRSTTDAENRSDTTSGLLRLGGWHLLGLRRLYSCGKTFTKVYKKMGGFILELLLADVIFLNIESAWVTPQEFGRLVRLFLSRNFFRSCLLVKADMRWARLNSLDRISFDGHFRCRNLGLLALESFITTLCKLSTHLRTKQWNTPQTQERSCSYLHVFASSIIHVSRRQLRSILSNLCR